MFTQSYRFKKFLHYLFPAVESNYLCLFKDTNIIGAIPTFLIDGPQGQVVNSLPFFGSHGGIILDDLNDKTTKDALAGSFSQFTSSLNLLSSTVIDSIAGSPWEEFRTDGLLMNDFRTAQISDLPNIALRPEIERQLMSSFHIKTRNMIRKGLKSGFSISHNNSTLNMNQMFNLHVSNMSQKVGGNSKPSNFVEAVLTIFKYDVEYRVYFAHIKGEIASALLIFYFKDQVEYFMPVIESRFKNLQPLSALIYTAMVDAVYEKNMKKWNWGGTRSDQNSLLRFKERWGAKSTLYKYNTFVPGKKFLSNEELINARNSYPFFYIQPQ
jgi:lipid II:glycine glycyltransferase (peptidoglycan interpeptide bridge formation enzyme)